ncbi:transporter [Pyxidicoccus fallax]|uniref:Transporter n=1 Tax=Pyxidicoccus fallax TaxID=394095 RepID=A0A848LWI9_9BACT|nr:transporter [Pyxidicoccus fallax]NMO21922.1 transporter [Pyxidicoccus fallax]NPC83413.1 transporter [Pyxidicoccus fallax]
MKRALLAVLFVSLLSATGAQAQQADFRDYEAGFYVPHRGIIAHTYLRHVSASSDQRDFSQMQAAFRATYVLKFGELVVVPFDVSLPVVDVTVFQANPASPAAPKTALRASGVGDITYIPTVGYGWVQDAETRTQTWVALTPYVTLPTGRYDSNRFVNVGSNRWTVRPQLVLGQRFLKAFTAEIMANVGFHGDNDEFLAPVGTEVAKLNLSQAPSLGGVLALGMDLSPTFFTGAAYYIDAAGKRTLDTPVGEVEVSPRQTVQSLRLTMGIRLEKASTLMLQFQPDIAASEGVAKGQFVGARFVHAFF